MPIHNFGNNDEKYSSIDELKDFRSEMEKENTLLSAYNNDKADLALYERNAEEIINISGAWTKLFLKEPTNSDTEDPTDIYDEDRSPQYRSGISIKAFVKFNAWTNELTRWGIDTPLTIDVTFSRAILGKTIGFNRMLKPGDVIEVPYNRSTSKGPLRFRVKNEKEAGAVNYRWLYYVANAELMVGDDSLDVPFGNAFKKNPKEVRRG